MFALTIASELDGSYENL